MFEKLKGVEERFLEIEKQLSDPDIVKDRAVYEKYTREHSELSKIITVYRTYKKKFEELEGSRELLKDGDSDIMDMAREEVETLSRDIEAQEDRKDHLTKH